MAPGRTRDVVFTYRYLRGAMIALLLMLLLSVGYQWWWETDHSCWLGSISAYYYTPARTVFVGSLCALGASLIAYKGHSPEEDVLLNFSGFMAFVVAMVPTVPDGRCGPNAYTQSPADGSPRRVVRRNPAYVTIRPPLDSSTFIPSRRRAVRTSRSRASSSSAETGVKGCTLSAKHTSLLKTLPMPASAR